MACSFFTAQSQGVILVAAPLAQACITLNTLDCVCCWEASEGCCRISHSCLLVGLGPLIAH